MSVQQFVVPMLDVYPRKPDRKDLPSHRWWARKTVAGDATGGFIQIYTAYATEDIPNYWWNVESAQLACGTSTNALLYVEPKEFQDVNLVLGGAMAVGTILSAIYYPLARDLMAAVEALRQPHRPRPNTNINYVALFHNNVNAVSYTMNLWGYVWEEDTMRYGGPVRPNP